MKMKRLVLSICILTCLFGYAQTTDDLVFLHHSVGNNWLNDGLHEALLAKEYINERHSISYNTDVDPDSGRPDSLEGFAVDDVPGDWTDMHDWVAWFNDYFGAIKTHDCVNGVNRIVMFKSCYPNSSVIADGTDPGDPFNAGPTTVNYKAVYRHPEGPDKTYLEGGYEYLPLEDVFAANPDTLFIAVTFPPQHYAPEDATTDDEAHRAREFNNWLKNEWLPAYKAATGLNNVAVFDFFNVVAYPDDHAMHPNRLREEYGGAAGDSHPNETANADATEIFASGPDNFLDAAWDAFTEGGTGEPFDPANFDPSRPFETAPPGSIIVEVGDSAEVCAPSGNDPYQWFKDDEPTPLSDGLTGSGSEIMGAITDTLRLANVKLEDTGNYHATWGTKAGSTTPVFVGVVPAASMPVAGGAGVAALAGACLTGGVLALTRRRRRR